jgi:hypothetical protein
MGKLRELRLGLYIAFTLAILPCAMAQLNVRGNAIIVDGRTIVDDPKGVEFAARSPGGKFIAYAHTNADAVVIVRNNGTLLRALPISENLGINAVMNVGWLDETRVWMDGHRSPTSGALCIWSIDGRRIDVREGAMFTPSPDGRSIAQVEPLPGHPPPSIPRARLMIDNRLVYPLRGAPGEFSRLVWSPDSSRLAAVESFDARQQLVVISRSGRLRRRKVIAGDLVTGLLWSGSRRVIVRQDTSSRTFVVP